MKTTANKIYPFFLLVLFLVFATPANSQVREPFQGEKNYEVQHPITAPSAGRQGMQKAGPVPPGGGGGGDEGGGWVGSEPVPVQDEDAYLLLLGAAVVYGLIKRVKKSKTSIHK